MSSTVAPEEIQTLIGQAVHSYFSDCQARVPAFVNNHYRYPGAWQTNRQALGLDLLRAPLNLFWAPVYGLISILRFGCQAVGYEKLARLLGRIPDGFTTRVQRYLARQLSDDLLRLHCPDHSLEAHITLKLTAHFGQLHSGKREREAFFHGAAAIVNEALQQYRVTRTASSDITNTLASTLLGAAAFNKFTPGGIGIGFLLAAIIARHQAENHFIFGKTLGKFYYHVFAPDPSWQLTTIALTSVLVLLACFASFSGLLTDPVQAHLGIHRRRLRKMLTHLEKDFLARAGNSFRPKDQYIARILDLFDTVKSHITY